MHQNFQSPEPQTVSKFHLGIVYSKQRRYQHCMPKYWRAHVRGLCAGTSMPMDKIGMHLSKLPRLEKKKSFKNALSQSECIKTAISQTPDVPSLYIAAIRCNWHIMPKYPLELAIGWTTNLSIQKKKEIDRDDQKNYSANINKQCFF